MIFNALNAHDELHNKPHELGSIAISILQMRKLRHVMVFLTCPRQKVSVRVKICTWFVMSQLKIIISSGLHSSPTDFYIMF